MKNAAMALLLALALCWPVIAEQNSDCGDTNHKLINPPSLIFPPDSFATRDPYITFEWTAC